MKYFMGIDNGGTVVKAAVFDENGNQLSSADGRVNTVTPAPGFAERDLGELWQVNVQVMREAAAGAGVPIESIAAVGLSGHGKGLYLLDKQGRPLGNGILSADNRALRYETQFMASPVGEYIRRTNRQSILACQPVCLLRWLKDERREVYDRVGAVLSVNDYIRYCLTGKIYAEKTSLSGSNLWNLTARDYDEDILRRFGIEEVRSALPPVAEPAQSCGTILPSVARATGLSEGTVVAGGMFDIDACALSVGLTDEADVCVIAGTWSINERISREASLSGASMHSVYCIPEYYLAEECSPTSAGNLEWVLRRFYGEEIASCGGMNGRFYEWLNSEIARVDPVGNGVLFLPFLYASNEGPGLNGAFLNLTAAADKAQIAEAVYEGVVFSHKSHIDRLLQGGKPVREVLLAGGAANSSVWSQMFADVLGMKVVTVQGREHGCFGAAAAASVAAGVFPDLADAAARASHRGKTYEPDAARMQMYKNKYASYRKAVQALRGLC